MNYFTKIRLKMPEHFTIVISQLSVVNLNTKIPINWFSQKKHD